MASAECSTGPEGVDYFLAAWQVADCIPQLRMRLEGQYLAVDAEAADAVTAAIGERSKKAAGIMQTERRKKAFLFGWLLFAQEFCRCSFEQYRFIFKQAA